MTFDPARHHRRSIRLPDFDYAGGGTFFVTICTNDRLCLFGDVVDGFMQLNEAGRMVQDAWCALPSVCSSIAPDAVQVMPNHVHGIVPLAANERMPLGEVVRRFKMYTTTRYVDGVRRRGWRRFRDRLWQRDYFDHVIRDDGSHASLREYIAANPSKWASDPENPSVAASPRE